MAKKPKICFIAYHACTRQAKMARALLKLGYEVHLCTTRLPEEWPVYSTVHMQLNDRQLWNSLKQIDADIYHVHNEPSWLVTKTRSVIGPKKKLVFDAHDWEALRCNYMKLEKLEPYRIKAMSTEILAAEVSDAIVYISDPIKKWMNKRLNYERPTTVLYSWPNEEWADTPEKLPKEGNVVYQGGIASPTKREEEWRNYLPIIKPFVDKGIDFHLYAFPQSKEERAEYEDSGATLHVPVPRSQLIGKLSGYNFGVFGTMDKSKNMQWCLPNKLWEYTAAGIPTLAVGKCEHTKEWVRKYNIGQVIDDLSDFELANPADFKESIWEIRKEWVMEKQIHKLEELYQKIL